MSQAEAGVMAPLDRTLSLIEFDPQGNILTANENYLRLRGYNLMAVQGKHRSMLSAPREVEETS